MLINTCQIIDQAIYESEKELQEHQETIVLDDAFHFLNKKFYNISKISPLPDKNTKNPD